MQACNSSDKASQIRPVAARHATQPYVTVHWEQMDRTAETDRISSDCWERALYAYGTATIFLKRSRKYKRLLQWLGFVGIIVPLVIGGAVLGFGLQASYLPALITVAAALGLLQLGFSAWSIVFSWSDNLAYGLESAADNFSLADSFKEMASQAMSPPADLQIQIGRAHV